MSARTGLVLADVAWARPENLGDVVDGILGYSGPAFPGLDWIRHWGKPFLLGYESSTTRAYAGGDAGAEDARQLISVARTLPGYIENNCGVWFCAADANRTPAWALPGCTEYARRFALELLTIGWRPTITLPYGNRDASNAGVAGAIVAGIAAAMWGVGTWGFAEGGGAYQLPGDSDAAVVQSGNTPGPADGTDYDALYRPLAELGFYGGPQPKAKALEEEDEMPLFTTSDDGGTTIQYYRDADGILVAIDPLQAIALGAFDPAVRKVNLGGVLAALAYNAETIAARKKLGLDQAVTLTDAQLKKVGAGITIPTLDPGAVADAVADRFATRLVS